MSRATRTEDMCCGSIEICGLHANSAKYNPKSCDQPRLAAASWIIAKHGLNLSAVSRLRFCKKVLGLHLSLLLAGFSHPLTFMCQRPSLFHVVQLCMHGPSPCPRPSIKINRTHARSPWLWPAFKDNPPPLESAAVAASKIECLVVRGPRANFQRLHFCPT